MHHCESYTRRDKNMSLFLRRCRLVLTLPLLHIESVGLAVENVLAQSIRHRACPQRSVHAVFRPWVFWNTPGPRNLTRTSSSDVFFSVAQMEQETSNKNAIQPQLLRSGTAIEYWADSERHCLTVCLAGHIGQEAAHRNSELKARHTLGGLQPAWQRYASTGPNTLDSCQAQGARWIANLPHVHVSPSRVISDTVSHGKPRQWIPLGLRVALQNSGEVQSINIGTSSLIQYTKVYILKWGLALPVFQSSWKALPTAWSVLSSRSRRASQSPMQSVAPRPSAGSVGPVVRLAALLKCVF